MSRTPVIVRAKADTAAVTLPQNDQFQPPLASRYLRITLDSAPARTEVVEVAKNRRAGAKGIQIFVQPGLFGLTYEQQASAHAKPVSVWAYRFSQLATPTGRLVTGTFIAAATAASIDGSFAVGKLMEAPLFNLDEPWSAILAGISMFCKLLSAGLAFLLALLFRK